MSSKIVRKVYEEEVERPEKDIWQPSADDFFFLFLIKVCYYRESCFIIIIMSGWLVNKNVPFYYTIKISTATVEHSWINKKMKEEEKNYYKIEQIIKKITECNQLYSRKYYEVDFKIIGSSLLLLLPFRFLFYEFIQFAFDHPFLIRWTFTK